MAQRRKGERVLGPYVDRKGWRVISVDATGKRESVVFDTEAKAARYIEILRADLAREEQTTAAALDVYREHLKTKGNKTDSIRQTCWAIQQFFPTVTSPRIKTLS